MFSSNAERSCPSSSWSTCSSPETIPQIQNDAPPPLTRRPPPGVKRKAIFALASREISLAASCFYSLPHRSKISRQPATQARKRGLDIFSLVWLRETATAAPGKFPRRSLGLCPKTEASLSLLRRSVAVAPNESCWQGAAVQGSSKKFSGCLGRKNFCALDGKPTAAYWREDSD